MCRSIFARGTPKRCLRISSGIGYRIWTVVAKRVNKGFRKSVQNHPANAAYTRDYISLVVTQSHWILTHRCAKTSIRAVDDSHCCSKAISAMRIAQELQTMEVHIRKASSSLSRTENGIDNRHWIVKLNFLQRNLPQSDQVSVSETRECLPQESRRRRTTTIDSASDKHHRLNKSRT